MYDVENVALVHHANSALRAHKLFRKDKDYIVRNDEVVIIDEFSGRMMPGRRYSEGLHQALEAKERVKIQAENQTLASITFQNYFRLYEKLAGMTGTAGDRGRGIRRHLQPRRRHHSDQPAGAAYRRGRRDLSHFAAEKFEAIADLIKECQERGQPVLVGTTSIEKVGDAGRAILRKKNVGADECAQCPAPRAGSLSSWPMPACRARSPLPRTWPAAVPTSSSAAISRCGSAKEAGLASKGTEREAKIAHIKSYHCRGKGQGAGCRRPHGDRHRTARKPPHRQPAAWPFGTARATPAIRNSSCRFRTT
jgi:hypothetical protein